MVDIVGETGGGAMGVCAPLGEKTAERDDASKSVQVRCARNGKLRSPFPFKLAKG